MTFTLAVCAEMVHADLPMVERVERLHAQGFAVEIWEWTKKDLAGLAETGARFTSMTGYVEGDLIDPDGADTLVRTAELSIEASRVLGTPNLNLHGTGLDGKGLPVKPVDVVTGEMWLAAQNTLRRIADLGQEHDVVFTLENLNLAVDHPGTPFARAADTMALVRSVGSHHLRMNLDLYHAQIGEGNLIELIREALPWVGEIQVADVPGRREPGTGEINYPAIARALAAEGYAGVVGLEGWPTGDSDVAVESFRSAFTL